tara:strand:+ start:1571 stop:4576 length:3006 start_codon:yes stop_codon:yes gene_type:complete
MNKFQFGTIMPQSRPVAFQYKPLGLEAFAAPLAMMQQRFDQTLDAVDKAKFDISTIDAKDKERAASITKEFNEYKNTLIDQLERTGNYGEISRRLKKLNEVYNTDAEITGIRQQTAATKKAIEEDKERIDGDKYTQDMHNKWKFKMLHEYGQKGGFNYNPVDGTYNTINTTLRGDSYDKEINKLVAKLASDAPLQVKEQAVKAAGYDDILYKFKDLPQVAGEIERFLKTSDRYQNYLEEKAIYDFYWNAHHYSPDKGGAQGYGLEVVNSIKDQFKADKKYWENIKSSGQVTNPADIETINNNIDGITQKQKEFFEAEQDAVNNNDFLNFARNSYIEATRAGELKNRAYTGTDIFDMNSVTFSGGGSGSLNDTEKTKLKDDLEITTVDHEVKAGASEVVQGMGTGSSDIVSDKDYFPGGNTDREKITDLNNAFNYKESEGYTINNDITGENTQDGSPISSYENLSQEDKNAYKLLNSNTRDAFSLFKMSEKWNNRIDDLETEAQTLRQNLKNHSGTKEEESKMSAELQILNDDIINSKIHRQANFNYLDYLIDEASNKQGGEWLGKLLDEGADRSVVYKEIYNHFLDNMKEVGTELKNLSGEFATRDIKDEQGNIIGQETVRIPRYDYTTDKAIVRDAVTVVNPSVQNQILNEELNKMRVGSGVPESNELTASLNQNPLISDMINKYKKDLSNNLVGKIPGIIMDSKSETFFKGDLKGISEAFENHNPGSDQAGKVVNYNLTTGVATNVADPDKFLNYDLKKYYNKPIFVGVDTSKGRNNIILEYNRRALNSDQLKSIVFKANPGKWEDISDVENDIVKEWQGNNPKTLYLASDRYSYNPKDKAQETFKEYVDLYIKSNDIDKMTNGITELENSMANINILSDNDTRREYLEAYARLNQIYQTENENDKITETPIITKNNPDGTRSGYVIDYRFEKGMGIMVDVKNITTRDGEIINTKYEPSFPLGASGIPTAQAMAAVNIHYGVGRKADNVGIVPAFLINR